MIKRFILPLLAVVLLGMTTSCGKDALLESTNTAWANFEIAPQDWEVDAETQNLLYSARWNQINNAVLGAGNVSAYLYERQNGIDRQVPLPYVYLVEFDDNGTPVYQPVNISYTIEPGVITFILSDLGDLLTNPNQLRTMKFRAVATWPVEYVIQQ